MAKASQFITNKIFNFKNGLFKAFVKVQKIPKRNKFPEGIKLNCVLINTDLNIPLLVVDNHEPFGYHMHTRLPYDKSFRVIIKVSSYEEAISLFMHEVQKVINDET